MPPHATASPPAAKARVYFPNLNAVRFIAAALVMVHHIEQNKDLYHLPNAWHVPAILVIGKLGVILFFVLSGFLISYLLFVEERQTGTVSIKDFYVRRILRIWPVYFLVVLTAFFVWPHVPLLATPAGNWGTILPHFWQKLGLYCIFMSNWEQLIYELGPVPFANISWSVGSEEQFYLLWPVLNRFIKRKVLLLLGVIAAYFLVWYVTTYHLPGRLYYQRDVFYDYWRLFPIDCMAIGGLYAWVAFAATPQVVRIRHFLYRPALQAGAYALVLGMFAFGVKLPVLHFEAYAVLFGLLILNLATNPASLLRLEHSRLNYLGKISYGLYMYHPVVLILSLNLLTRAGFFSSWLLYPMVFGGTVGVAALSYRAFEARFIKLKLGFSKVLSGDNVHTE